MKEDQPKSIIDFKLSEQQRKLAFFAIPAILGSQFLGFFISSYLGIELSGSLIFQANDGWCNTASQGIGIHCFGDFSSFMNYDVASPWSNSFPTAYPPLSVMFMAIFKWIHSSTNESNLALLSYLTLLIVTLISPAYFFLKSGISKFTTIIMFMFSLLLAPSLMIIDRGNNLGFCVPLIFLTYYFAIQRKYFHFQAIIVLLTLLKPQFALLSILLLLNNQARIFLVYIVNTSLSYIVFFLFFGPKELISNIANWFSSIFNYQSYVGLPTVYPSNLSFANLIALPITALSKLSYELEPRIEEIVDKTSFATSISIIFIIFILTILFIRRKTLNDIQVNTTLLITLIMAPSVSFSYYLSVLLPLVYLFLYTACVQDFDNFMHFKDFAQNTSAQIASILKTRVQRGVINGLTITCLIHWPIPWSILGISPVGGNSGNLSMVWTLSPVFLVLFLATLIFGDFKLKFGRSRV